METADGANIWTVLPNLIWFMFALVALFVFKNDIRGLMSNLIWKIKTGAKVEVGSFKLGESHVSTTEDIEKKGGTIIIRLDENDARYEERRKYYEPNRGVFLVHRLAPSKKPNQLYDILIYLIPHNDATLGCIQKVDYYFGHHWNNRIFTSIDRAKGFAISTSAFGSFLCTAEIHFTDGKTEMIWRYIDFEMGIIGKK